MKLLGTALLFLAGLSLCAAIPAAATNLAQDPPKPPDPSGGPAPKPVPPSPDGPEENRMRDSKAALRLAGVLPPNNEKTAKQYEALARWFEKELGRPIEVTPVPDAAAAIQGFANNKFDAIWVDAIGAVKAEEATKRRCQPVLARVEDLGLTTYWVAAKRLVDDATFRAVEEKKPMSFEVLAGYKPKLSALKFSFGSRNSLGTHAIPRFVMEQPAVGIDPEKAFREKPAYAGEGGEDALLAAVASGSIDLAVVGRGVWERAAPELQAKAPVVFVSPEYANHCMMIHFRTGPAFPIRLIKAFLMLDPAKEDQKAVLELLGATKFVHARTNHLDGTRGVIQGLLERKLLD